MPDFLSSIFGIGILALYIYAIVKYNDVKKKNNSVLYQQSGNIQQPVQPVVENQPVVNESFNQNIDNSVSSINSNNI